MLSLWTKFNFQILFRNIALRVSNPIIVSQVSVLIENSPICVNSFYYPGYQELK